MNINDALNNQENVQEFAEIRPKTLSSYIGQENIKRIISVSIQASKQRNEPLEHMLFYGPPGLGKTTIACVIANEMNKNIKITTGPAIEKTGDIIALFSSLSEGDIVFIDEIHRLNKHIEEILYPAMEDFAVDIFIGEGPSKQSIRIELPKFTLIGATTRAGMLSAPLRDRFGTVNKMEFYTPSELTDIIKRSAQILKIEIDDEGAREIALCSRGTPRLANRLLRQIRNFAQIEYQNIINKGVVLDVLSVLGIDNAGLDRNDKKYLKAIYDIGSGCPVGLSTLTSSLGEDEGTIIDVYEPFLLQEGYINKTPRGRVLTEKGLACIKNKKVF